jgi:hypothetical protein
MQILRTPFRSISRRAPSRVRVPLSPSEAFGVAYPASFTCDPSIGCIFAPGLPSASSFATAVGHPDKPQSLSDVRRADARSAQIDRPAGVIRSFQVSLNKVEPSKAVLARNLLQRCS